MIPPPAGPAHSPRFIGMIFAGTCLIWGSTFMALKVGLQETPPLLGVALRHLIASVILLAVIWFKSYKIPWDRLTLKQYATVGLLNFSLDVRTHTDVRNFLYADSILISVDW